MKWDAETWDRDIQKDALENTEPEIHLNTLGMQKRVTSPR